MPAILHCEFLGSKIQRPLIGQVINWQKNRLDKSTNQKALKMNQSCQAFLANHLLLFFLNFHFFFNSISNNTFPLSSPRTPYQKRIWGILMAGRRLQGVSRVLPSPDSIESQILA
jgi:hypothetical protein